MEVVTIIIKSLIIGGLGGFAVGVGAARMFHAPATQGMGAFRTLGEMNACEGDAVSHFSFGLGFFFNAWATVVGSGALTQDVLHRIIPNWGAGALLIKNKDVSKTMHNPRKMGIVGAVIGAVVVAFLNATTVAVPGGVKDIATVVLVPAANLLINYAMPVLFWLAAMDAGKRSGMWGTIFGGLAHLIMGNAVPGVVLGILIGKGVDDDGWNRLTKTLLTAIIILFTLSAFFRGVDMKLITQMGLDVPSWLQGLHDIFTFK